MPALDWAERKLDRSIISIGESCKTWFQEVWRLVFRVLVFVLSILLGFLHKPSFEKWVAEQRGRIHTRRNPADPLHQTNLSSPTHNPRDSARSHGAMGSFEFESPTQTHDGFVADANPDSPRNRTLSKRKSGRLARTGFAELLHRPMTMTPDPASSPSLLDQPHPRRSALSTQSQPSSYTDDSYLDSELEFDRAELQATSAPHRRTLRPSSIAIPTYDDDEDANMRLSARSGATNDEDFENSFERASATSDDYDEFYGPKKDQQAYTTDVPPRSKRKHVRQSSQKGKNLGISFDSAAGSPGSFSGGIHMFSMEGIDYGSSPLLNMRRAEQSSGNTPRENDFVDDESKREAYSETNQFKTKSPWRIDNEADDTCTVEDAGSNDDSNSNFSAASAPTITSGVRRSSSIGEYANLQAQSVPHHPVSTPLEAQKSKKSKSRSDRRSSHKRARSMSPSASSNSLYSASSVSMGGTGRRSTSRRNHSNGWFNQRYSTIDIHKDRIFTSDKLNTGAMQDLRMWILLCIDAVTNFFRSGVRSIFSLIRNFSIKNLLVGTFTSVFNWLCTPHAVLKSIFLLIWNLTFGLLIVLFYLPSRFLSGVQSSSFDRRSTKAIVLSQGYPYEIYEVVTDDGYILRLERLARPKSNRIIYFQHGVVDNSFAWFGHVEGEAGSALAFRAFDQGYDVFVGTFRGCEGSTRHMKSDSDFSSSQYWNFSVNEHGMFDLKAFIDKIVSIKKQELGDHFEPRNGVHTAPLSDNQFDIMLIAHSMGAMASLIYLVWSKIQSRQHHVSCAILLSPAGYHMTAPIIVDIMGPIINVALWLFPWIHTLKFPGTTIRLLVSKILEDVNNSFTGRTVMSWGVAKVIGGSIEDHPFVNLRNLTYNVFSGTSTGVYRHFWQIWRHKKFEGFDYGPKKNLQIYGTKQPLDFIENYNLYANPNFHHHPIPFQTI